MLPSCYLYVTPMLLDAKQNGTRRDYMVNDGWPVIAEDFSQWVIESNFCNEMPAWDKVWFGMVRCGEGERYLCTVVGDRST